jgi:proteasome accessory factor C
MNRRASETASARLARLLAMVPWLSANDGVTIAETAAHFGVSEKQVQDDLWLLICTGRPGHLHGDLVDIQFWDEAGTIHVLDAQTLDRPLRLTPDEAAALVVALRYLEQVPGVQQRDVLASTITKLETAAGEALSAAEGLSISVDSVPAAVAQTAAQAVNSERRVHMVYVSATDERSERDVDPMRLLTVDGRSYLEGWCLSSEAVRTFRLDRIEQLDVLDQKTEIPVDAAGVDLSMGLRPDGPIVTLSCAPEAAWIADEYPHDSIEEDGNGGLLVTLPVSDLRWLQRLLLRMGASVRVVDRPDISGAVAQAARAALARYSGQ